MIDGLQTVSFQAAKTNSSPPPSALPYHIEQGLMGEVGTTRLPSALSNVCQFFLKFIAIINFIGILWILWAMPVIAALLATCVAGISLSLAGLFHSIPYLEQRRSSWTPTNWRLLHLCFAISWAAASVVAYFLVFHPPSIPERFYSARNWTKSRTYSTAVEYPIFSNQCTQESDPYRRMLCRQAAAGSIRQVRREVEQAPEPDNKPDSQDDFMRLVMIYAAAVAALGAIHGIAAYGAPFAAETGNAIWREPHTGYLNNPAAGAPEDPAAKLKKKGFDHWLKSNISLGGDTSVSVDAAHDDYRRNLEKHVIPPPPYSLSEFKAAFKSATGKEPIEIKGVPSYQGVSFAGGALL
jgi:hypothetical protein